jgi:hypothetical protein
MGSQGPPARLKIAPPPVICAEAHRAVAPAVVACSEVLADQQTDDWCSYMWCGECEPSII